MNEDAVSVVIPLRDGARHLPAALESVRAQSAPVAEIVVVDDGSTDDGPEIARRFGARVVSSPGHGAGAARNAGARIACGPWLAFLDADDLWMPRRIEAGLAAVRDAARDVHVFGRIRQFFDLELGRSDRPSPEIFAAPHPDTLLVRAAGFLADGGYPEDGVVGEIVVWAARLADLGRPVIMVPEVLAERRIHTRNTGVLHRDDRAGYARALRTVIAARRARSGAEGAS